MEANKGAFLAGKSPTLLPLVLFKYFILFLQIMQANVC